MAYVCPYCYEIMPQCHEPQTWAHCGEIGHAVLSTDECPKCHAEMLQDGPCVVCGTWVTL